MQKGTLVPAGWNPKKAGDEVLQRLVSVTAPHVQGAHDADLELVDNRAYIVSTVNEVMPGHSACDCEYAALSVVNLDQLQVETASIPIARSEQSFTNETLPVGQCWVPRITRLDQQTLRIFFTSQKRGVHCQVWYRDFDLAAQSFYDQIYRVKLKTSVGVFPMQPQPFYEDAAAHGFSGEPADHGLYVFDSFKTFDGITYVAINNFPGRHIALTKLNRALDTFEIVGHIFQPEALALSEAAVNRLPDGKWMAVIRTENGPLNYAFSESSDGRDWAPAEYLGCIQSGTNSKPNFERFNGLYYLGWQDAEQINSVPRSVFNLDISRDGRTWERRYRFETTSAFEYPTFARHRGSIWLTISGCNQRTIKFGKLEDLDDSC